MKIVKEDSEHIVADFTMQDLQKIGLDKKYINGSITDVPKAIISKLINSIVDWMLSETLNPWDDDTPVCLDIFPLSDNHMEMTLNKIPDQYKTAEEITDYVYNTAVNDNFMVIKAERDNEDTTFETSDSSFQKSKQDTSFLASPDILKYEIIITIPSSCISLIIGWLQAKNIKNVASALYKWNDIYYLVFKKVTKQLIQKIDYLNQESDLTIYIGTSASWKYCFLQEHGTVLFSKKAITQFIKFYS